MGSEMCIRDRSKQVPLPLKIFLLALAIIDDLGAIVVIALFFSHGLSIQALIFAAVAIVVLIALNRFKVTALCAYMVVGTILWASVLKSGVHATLAGVIIGFCIPLKGKNDETPLHDFEHILAPWSSFVILPLFAFANAGVSFDGIDLIRQAKQIQPGLHFIVVSGYAQFEYAQNALKYLSLIHI